METLKAFFGGVELAQTSFWYNTQLGKYVGSVLVTLDSNNIRPLLGKKILRTSFQANCAEWQGGGDVFTGKSEVSACLYFNSSGLLALDNSFDWTIGQYFIPIAVAVGGLQLLFEFEVAAVSTSAVAIPVPPTTGSFDVPWSFSIEVEA